MQGWRPALRARSANSALGSLDETLAKQRGRHSLRVGFQGDILRYNVQNPMSGFGNGSAAGLVFDRRFTQSNSILYNPDAAPVSSGDPMASMLLGDFSTANYNDSIAYATQQIYLAPYFQDDWRVNSKLTVNLGARYDYESPLTERYNRMIAGFCTTCVNPLQASVSGLALNGGLQFVGPSNRFPFPHDTHNMAPRLGAAYQVRPNTVVRGGFGIIFFNTLETPFSTGFSQSTSYNNYTSSAPLNSASDPFPTGVVLPTGNTLGLETGLGQTISFNDQKHVTPRAAEYTLNIQQQLPYNISLQVGYVGSRPTRLEVSDYNINALPASYFNQGSAEVTYLNAKVTNPMAGQFASTYANNATLNAATIQQYLLLVPYPEFGAVNEYYTSTGSTPYNSLQIQVSHPMSHHLSIQGNFTWDKLMLHNAFLNNGSGENTPLDTKLESVQDNNSNVLANIFGTYELPTFASSPYWERMTIGGWKLNGRSAHGQWQPDLGAQQREHHWTDRRFQPHLRPLHQHLLREHQWRPRCGPRSLRQFNVHTGLPAATLLHHPNQQPLHRGSPDLPSAHGRLDVQSLPDSRGDDLRDSRRILQCAEHTNLRRAQYFDRQHQFRHCLDDAGQRPALRSAYRAIEFLRYASFAWTSDCNSQFGSPQISLLFSDTSPQRRGMRRAH